MVGEMVALGNLRRYTMMMQEVLVMDILEMAVEVAAISN